MSEPVPTVGPGMHVGPVIAVSDLDAARAFYEGRLGLTGERTPGGWALEAGGGSVVYLLDGVPGAGSATWPVASFRVDDAHATVREFRGRGVSFLGPDDLPFALDDDGVSVGQPDLEVAWLRNQDGNVLTVFSLPTSREG